MKRLMVYVLVFVVLLCSVVYGFGGGLGYIRAMIDCDINYRETCFRHDEKQKYYEYKLAVVEYQDQLLGQYGY